MYLENPEDIEAQLQAHLKKHFAQAEETPFRQPHLGEGTDFSASTETARKVLSNETDYDNDKMNLATLMLLLHCKKDWGEDISVTMTDKQFDGKLKSWKESTTTSPSGVHLGHLKSYYATHSLDPESDEGKVQEG